MIRIDVADVSDQHQRAVSTLYIERSHARYRTTVDASWGRPLRHPNLPESVDAAPQRDL